MPRTNEPLSFSKIVLFSQRNNKNEKKQNKYLESCIYLQKQFMFLSLLLICTSCIYIAGTFIARNEKYKYVQTFVTNSYKFQTDGAHTSVCAIRRQK